MHNVRFLQPPSWGEQSIRDGQCIAGSQAVHTEHFGFLILLGSICFLFYLICSLLDCWAPSPVWSMHMHRQGMRGRKGQLQFTKASEEEKESKMNLGGHGRKREGDARGWKMCYMQEMEWGKGSMWKIKEKLEGEHRDTRRREHKNV